MDSAKFIDVDGYRTRYFAEGSGEPVVFVTGGEFGTIMAAREWAPNFDDLKQDYAVYALDKLGQGMTDNPRTAVDYVVDNTVTHLCRFIELIDAGPVHLVGHSRGGYAVTRVALERPDLVRSLTVIDSGSLMHQSAPFWSEVFTRSALIEDPRERYTYEMHAASFDPATVTDDLIDDVMSFATSAKYDEARIRTAENLVNLQRRFLVRQAEIHQRIEAGELAHLPVLVVWAFNDQSAPIEECGVPAMHLFLENVPRCSMHIVNRSGHYPHREQPAEVSATLRHFLAAAGAPDPLH